MRSVSSDARRATQDIDMDFIRYSISDAAIDEFLSKLNCLGRITIERTGKITKLKQQDYHGKSDRPKWGGISRRGYNPIWNE